MQYKDYLQDLIRGQGKLSINNGVYTLDLTASIPDTQITRVEDDFIILQQLRSILLWKKIRINHVIPLSSLRLILKGK